MLLDESSIQPHSSGHAAAPSPFTGLPLHTARVVLADPAWHFATYSQKGWHKSAHALAHHADFNKRFPGAARLRSV